MINGFSLMLKTGRYLTGRLFNWTTVELIDSELVESSIYIILVLMRHVELLE